jgi:hypothetical protein
VKWQFTRAFTRLCGQLERRMHGWVRYCWRNTARVARCLATVGLRRPRHGVVAFGPAEAS